MANQSKSKSCPICHMRPVLMSIRIFGLKIVEPCDCNQFIENSHFENNFRIYQNIIEISLYEGIIIIPLMSINKDMFCARSFKTYGDNQISVEIVIFILCLFMTIQYSILKRNCMHFSFKKSSYDGEEKEISLKIEFISLLILSITFFISVASSFSVSIANYDILKNEGCSDVEAFICTIGLNLSCLFAIGQISSVALVIVLGLIINYKRYKKLSEELSEMNPRSVTKNEIESFIEKQNELWKIFQDINEKYGFLLLWEYGNLVYISCFFLYGLIFISMHNTIKMVLLFLTMIIISGVIFVSFALSKLISSIYDNFIDIRKVASCNFSVEYKFKILNFMKRNGKTPIGLSMAGFFFVKKNFVFRVANALYSVFSSFLQLRESTNQSNTKCRLSVPTNRTM